MGQAAPAIELHHDLPCSVIVHKFKLADVACVSQPDQAEAPCMLEAALLRRRVRTAEGVRKSWAGLPCFIMTCRNFTTTFELGRSSTCLLPLFSALCMVLRASCITLTRTMAANRYQPLPSIPLLPPKIGR